MRHYVASYVPLIPREDKKIEILSWDPDSKKSKPARIKISCAFDLKSLLQPGDHLWLMMGSTNAALALAAFRRGVVVHQLSLPRLLNWLAKQSQQEKEEEGERRFKVKLDHVLAVSQQAPHLFYEMNPAQAEVLEISSAWQAVEDATKAWIGAANLIRSRLYREALVDNRVGKEILSSNPKKAVSRLRAIISDLLDTKDERGRKRTPNHRHIAYLVEERERQLANLARVCQKNSFFQFMFGDVEGVGPFLGASFIAAIERIERFPTPEDLSNYAGMLPRGKEGQLPSRKRSKGQLLSRSPKLNTACFGFQEHMFQWGRKTPLGQMLNQEITRLCPCTQEERNHDKELRRRHAEAVKVARIHITRYFLEAIVWPRWKEYLASR